MPINNILSNLPRPQLYLANNPYAPPSFYYPLDLGSVGEAPYLIFDIRKPVAAGGQSLGTIATYLPPSALKVSYDAKYSPATDAVNALQGILNSRLGDLGVEGASLALGGILDSLTGLNIGQSILKRADLAINPHAALFFEGVGFRNFEFTLQFVAKSAQESEMINNIIYRFKYHMHPSFQGGTPNRYFNYPDNFVIGLYSPADKYLFKISNCVLENMSVDYNGGTEVPSFFSATGAPVSIVLNLKFTEQEIMTKERIEQGF